MVLGYELVLLLIMQMFTVDLVGVNFTVHHPVGLEHHISGQSPRGSLVWVQNGFPRNPETQQHDGHDDHDVEHVGHLRRTRERSALEDTSGSNTALTLAHHLPDHHDVGSSLLIDRQDIQQPHVPEDDVQTVHDPARDEHAPRAEAQAEAHEEHQDGQEIRNVEVVAEPDFNLLTDFASFRHEHLERKH